MPHADLDAVEARLLKAKAAVSTLAGMGSLMVEASVT
jgi:hypothetical protein